MKKIVEKLLKEIDGWDDGAEDLHAIAEELQQAANGSKLTRLFRKNGEFSVTRAILILSWIAGLSMYVFGSLFAGFKIPAIGAIVPAFDSAAFLAVTGAASSLYFANHNVKLGQPKN